MDVNASNVLLCLRYGIGDLITELPLIDRLRESLPEATIIGLGAEPAVEILKDRRSVGPSCLDPALGHPAPGGLR